MERESHLERLRATMMRLAEELDGARLYQSAAYISMAADSIGGGAGAARLPGAEGGSRIPGLPQDRHARDDESEVDLDFTLDEHGLVWLIKDGDCHRLGPGEAVCAEMRRFLAGVAAGGDGYA